MVVEYIRMLKVGLREQARQAAADRREGEGLLRRADDAERRGAEQERILELLEAALGITGDEADEAGSIAVESPVYERGSTIRQMLGDNWEYLVPRESEYFPPDESEYVVPDKDEETKEPKYEVSVVSGLRNSRERAFAAARVYGPELRERALARAIFLTGETGAADEKSVRGSLGGLVKYGTDWRRERGTLIYKGKELKPDWETMRRLLGAVKEQRPQGSHGEGFSHTES